MPGIERRHPFMAFAYSDHLTTSEMLIGLRGGSWVSQQIEI